MTKAKALPPEAVLHKLFHYNSVTGELRRRRSGKLINVNTSHGYRSTRLNNEVHRAHRIIWKMVTGDCPEGSIDHINGDRGDNRIDNLRVVTHQENLKNQKLRKTNTSGVVGVLWHKRYKKWAAKIMIDGKYKHLGYFTDKVDAIYARYYAEQDHGYHENHGRR